MKPARSETERSLPSSTATPVQDDAAGQGEAGEQIVPVEIGGRRGLDPTRYGDWEKNGRCIDF